MNSIVETVNQNLEKKGIHIDPTHEIMSGEGVLKTPDKIVSAAIAAGITAIYADDIRHSGNIRKSRMFAAVLLENYSAGSFLSGSQREMITGDSVSEEQAVNAIWGYESVAALLYVAGLIEELPFPDKFYDVDDCLNKLETFKKREDLTKGIVLIDKNKFDLTRETYHRLEFACRKAGENNEDPPAGMIENVVVYRLRALEYACTEKSWDNLFGALPLK